MKTAAIGRTPRPLPLFTAHALSVLREHGQRSRTRSAPPPLQVSATSGLCHRHPIRSGGGTSPAREAGSGACAAARASLLTSMTDAAWAGGGSAGRAQSTPRGSPLHLPGPRPLSHAASGCGIQTTRRSNAPMRRRPGDPADAPQGAGAPGTPQMHPRAQAPRGPRSLPDAGSPAGPDVTPRAPGPGSAMTTPAARACSGPSQPAMTSPRRAESASHGPALTLLPPSAG